MAFIVYQITHKASGRYYRGKTSIKNWMLGYMGSSVLLGRAITKYGKDAFRREILESFDDEDCAYGYEAMVVVPISDDRLSYNISGGGRGNGSGYANPMSGNSVAGLSISRKNKVYWSCPQRRKDKSETTKTYFEDPVNRKQASDKTTAYFQKPENRDSVSKKQKDFMANPDSRENMREKTTAYFEDPKNRERLSLQSTEQWSCPVARAKQSECRKEYFKNPDNRQKARERQLAYLANPANAEKIALAKERARLAIRQRNGVYIPENGYKDLFSRLTT